MNYNAEMVMINLYNSPLCNYNAYGDSLISSTLV